MDDGPRIVGGVIGEEGLIKSLTTYYFIGKFKRQALRME